MSAIDYIVGEELTEPSGTADTAYSEAIVRLTHRNCYLAPLGCPNVGPSPYIKNGFVTFGSFNNLGKITPSIILAWSMILRRVEGSQIVLRNSVAAQEENWTNPVGIQLIELGVRESQIKYLPHVKSREEAITAYLEVDIALDTFPCNGGTTTCDALYMGVPVITITGQTFMGRQASTYLTKVNHSDLIANNVDEYIEKSI